MSENTKLQIFMVMRIHVVVFGVITLCNLVWGGAINVSEEHTASIFRVETNQASKMSGYIGKVERDGSRKRDLDSTSGPPYL
jgi:hypothetical protein